jgi:outer membrane protein assembly factor BamB
MIRTTTRSRRPIAAVAFSLLALLSSESRTLGETPLVPQEQAARNGLERAWFAQIPVDPGRSRVTSWYLFYDRIYAVTDSGIVTALNSETGEQLWAKQVGKPGHAAFGPGANSKYLGVVSGAKLYMLDRQDGRALWVRDLGSAPSSGPALSRTYAYVALMSGRIEGYKLDDPNAQPWYYQSTGRTMLRPTTTGEVVSWPTTAGYLYVSGADKPGVLFRLETNADIITSPAQADGFLYIASLDGYLYAINETTGREKWRFSTGYEVSSSPAIVDKHVYVASAEPALHALNSDNGREYWTVPGVSHFGAQGKGRLYASDRFGNILVIDEKSGSILSHMRTDEGQYTLVNSQTDRLYLVNDVGLIQCLHEIGAKEPTIYRVPPTLKPPAVAKTGAAVPAATPPAAATPTPPAGEAPAMQPPEFGAEAGAPAAEVAPEAAPQEKPAAPQDDNPFD